MKLKINKRKFDKELDILFRALDKNSPLIQLRAFLIEVNQKNIFITSSNGNLSIKHKIEDENIVKILKPGKVLVNGQMLRNVIKKQPNEISIEVEEKTLKIYSKETNANIQLLNVDDYPVINFEAEGNDVEIEGKILSDIIKNVSFAAAERENRIILNGVNLKSKNGKMIATATDSFRIAIQKMEIDSKNEFEVTILSKNFKDFIPKNVRGILKININDSKMITKYKNTIKLSKLIDGVYPDIEPLIPNSFKYLLSINSDELQNLIDRVTVLSEEINKPIKIFINKNQIILKSERKEMGNIEVQSHNHKWDWEEDFSIVVGSRFLKEAISKFEGKIALAFNGPFEPFLIKGNSNQHLTQLISPQRSY